jgi:iron-sulfur cluster repair protein YtfE (RIC family)
MLVTLGNRAKDAPPDLRARLAECHERIRTFCALGRRLAQGAGGDEARDAAQQLHRYFSIGLPLHVADEEESLAPRLMRLGNPRLDDALVAMTREHDDLDENLDELLARWQEIIDQPTPARCAATRWQASCLLVHFEQHLAAEEARIFPAIAQLPPAQTSAIVAEMVARRSSRP